jgi:hypothetical protein
MPVHRSRLAPLYEPVTPFEEVLTSYAIKVEGREDVVIEHGRKAGLGCKCTVHAAVPTQILDVSVHGLAYRRTLDAP